MAACILTSSTAFPAACSCMTAGIHLCPAAPVFAPRPPPPCPVLLVCGSPLRPMLILTGPDDGTRDYVEPEADDAAFLSPYWQARTIEPPAQLNGARELVTDIDFDSDAAASMLDDDFDTALAALAAPLSSAPASARAGDLLETSSDLRPAIVLWAPEDGTRQSEPQQKIDADLLHRRWQPRPQAPAVFRSPTSVADIVLPEPEVAVAPMPISHGRTPLFEDDDDDDDDDEADVEAISHGRAPLFEDDDDEDEDDFETTVAAFAVESHVELPVETSELCEPPSTGRPRAVMKVVARASAALECIAEMNEDVDDAVRPAAFRPPPHAPRARLLQRLFFGIVPAIPLPAHFRPKPSSLAPSRSRRGWLSRSSGHLGIEDSLTFVLPVLLSVSRWMYMLGRAGVSFCIVSS